MTSAAPVESLERRVATLAGSRVLVGLVESLSMILLVRVTTRADLGVLSLAFVVLEVARQLGAMGLPEATLVFAERTPLGAHQLLLRAVGRELLRSAVFVAALVGIALPIAAPWLPTLSSDARVLFAHVAAYFGVGAFFDVLGAAQSNYLVARGRTKAAGVLSVGASLIIGVLVLVGASIAGVNGVAIAVSGGAIVRWAVGRHLVSKLSVDAAGDEAGAAEVDLAQLRNELRSFSRPLGMHVVVARLHRHLDKALVVLVLGETAGAAYTAVTIEIPFITALPFAVGTAILGRLVSARARGDHDAILSLHHRGIRKIGLAVVPMTTFLLVFADVVVPVVLGDRYADAVLPFRIAMLVGYQRVAQFGAVLQAFEATRSIFLYTLVMLTTNLLLSFPAMHLLGILGAASASAFASYLAFWLYQGRIGQLLGVPWYRAFPVPDYARQILLCIICCAPIVVVDRMLAPGLAAAPRLAVDAASYLVLYGVVGMGIGRIRRTDLRSLAALLGLPSRQTKEFASR